MSKGIQEPMLNRTSTCSLQETIRPWLDEANIYDLISIEGASFQARILSEVPIPSLTRSFIMALKLLVGSSGADTPCLNIHVKSKIPEGMEQILAQHFEVPKDGILAMLPRTDWIRILVTPDQQFLAIDWQLGGGLIFAERKSDRCFVYLRKNYSNLGWVLNYLTATCLTRAGLCRVAHATVVRIGGRNIMIGGASGSGKTTFALLLAVHGGSFLTEDITYLDDRSRFSPQPIRDFFHIRAGTCIALGKLLEKYMPGITQLFPQNLTSQQLYELGKSMQVRISIDEFRDKEFGLEPALVDLVVLPTLCADVEHTQVESISNSIANFSLENALPLSMIDWVSWLMKDSTFPPSWKSSPLHSHVPAFRVTFGLNYIERFNELMSTLGIEN